MKFANISSLCVPIVVSILGIAFPILIQSISQIDVKYESNRLVDRFKREPLYIQLWISLIISVVFLFYNNIVFLPWSFDWGIFNYIMINSSDIMTLLSTVYLIYILFRIVHLIIEYFDYSKLFEKLFKSSEKSLDTYKIIFFEEIKFNNDMPQAIGISSFDGNVDLNEDPDNTGNSLYKEESIFDIDFNQNISKSDDPSSKKSESIKTLGDDFLDLNELAKYILPKDDNNTLHRFYDLLYRYTSVYNSEKSKEGVIYNEWFYNLILTFNDAVCKQSVKPISMLNENTPLKILIPEEANVVISDKTYIVLWKSLQQQLFYNKTEWVYEYWAFAHQYIFQTLKPIKDDFTFIDSEPISNNAENVKKRQNQIDRFKEFHLFLCGYILFVKKYDLIDKITDYTQSEPYSFPLVPSTFNEIMDEFKKLPINSLNHVLDYDLLYSFIGVKGVDSIYMGLAWARRYLVLLLFRLNTTIVNYMIFKNNSVWDYKFDNKKDFIEQLEFMERLLIYTRVIDLEKVATMLDWYVDDSKYGERNKNHPLNKISYMKIELS